MSVAEKLKSFGGALIGLLVGTGINVLIPGNTDRPGLGWVGEIDDPDAAGGTGSAVAPGAHIGGRFVSKHSGVKSGTERKLADEFEILNVPVLIGSGPGG